MNDNYDKKGYEHVDSEYRLYSSVMNVNTKAKRDYFDQDFTNSYLTPIKARFILDNMKMVVSITKMFNVRHLMNDEKESYKNENELSKDQCKEIEEIGEKTIFLLYQDAKGELHISKSVDGKLMHGILDKMKTLPDINDDDKSMGDYIFGGKKKKGEEVD